MHFEQIRNACVKISFAGVTFLVDPWLAAKGEMGCFADFDAFKVVHPEQAHLPMPLCDLPKSVDEILAGVDCYVITHVHPDHIDMAPDGTVGKYLDKNVPAFVQSEEDAAALKNSGFATVYVLGEETSFKGVELVKTPGVHGTQKPCGPSCGVVFRHPNEKTVYLAGDTIWYAAVEEAIKTYAPDVTILNACAAELEEYGRLIMDDQDVANVVAATRAANPAAEVIVSHMDNVAHASITRATMRERLEKRGILDQIRMPADAEVYTF